MSIILKFYWVDLYPPRRMNNKKEITPPAFLDSERCEEAVGFTNGFTISVLLRTSFRLVTMLVRYGNDLTHMYFRIFSIVFSRVIQNNNNNKKKVIFSIVL